jgi:integrase
MAASGARRGEVCALLWSDVDQQGAALRIDESVVAAGGGATVKSPKTRASIRVVALDPQTLEALRGLRVHAESLARDCKVTLAEDGFGNTTADQWRNNSSGSQMNPLAGDGTIGITTS